MVRLVLFPLTAKQAKSMIAMQRVQPEIKKLQAKYKNDRQKLNEEMMKFYKENQINPLGGCLPLLAADAGLHRAVPDAAQHPALHPDELGDVRRHLRQGRALARSSNLDFFGMNLQTAASQAPKGFGDVLPYYVLVGLVVISAFLQQRQTMRNQTQVNTQMQVIGKVLPVIFGFISINIPAGVVLYFLTSNIWQIGQQEVVYRTVGAPNQPPKGKAARLAAAKNDQDPGGKAAPPIEAKSTETPSPASTGGVKGLFKSLSPGTTPTDDAAPSGNGKPQPNNGGSAAKTPAAKKSPAKSTPPKATPTAKQKPGSGTSGKAGATAPRKNNRKRKR